MTRIFLVVAMFVTVACHRPSLTGGVKSLGAEVGKLGGGIVAVVKPIAPRVDTHIDAQVAATTVAAIAADQAEQRAGTIEPVTIHKTVGHHGDHVAPAPSPAPSTTPTVITTKRTVAPPPVFTLRSTTRNGKRSCEKFTSMEECNTTCTGRLRVDSMRTDTDALQGCVCMEATGC